MRDTPPAAAATPASALVHPFPDLPAPDEPVEVAQGIHWLRMPLPFALDHVNLWLIEDDGGWTLIDTGIDDARTRAIWQATLAGPLAGRPVRRIIATHFHPDHVGLAAWLVRQTGAPLWMSRIEWLTARMLGLDTTDDFVEARAALYRRAGLDDDAIAAQRARGNHYRKIALPAPPVYRPVGHGEEIAIGERRFRVLLGEGHAPAQITLASAEDRLLIAADQILPRITPNIAVGPSVPDADPLGAYLRSLDAYADLPADCLVLPSHDRPFVGLHTRIAQMHVHHERRLADALVACAAPATAREVLSVLFHRPLDAHQIVFAIGETLAHLNRLMATGHLRREPGADGVDRYHARLAP